MIRQATPEDIKSLLRLEEECFSVDRLSQRSFRYLLTKANAVTFVDERDGEIAGYVMLLFNAGTSLARLYSIAVSPRFRGRDIGKALVAAAEEAARERDSVYIRLEVRKDNAASIALFEQAGYRRFGEYDDYYEDHMDAYRYERRLVSNLNADLAMVPYYQQTLEFTCGPAALMMAMKALESAVVLDRTLEIRIWRESTTVFMTSGHGGTSPYGMALAAVHRGFEAEVFVNDASELLVDSVRSAEKKEVMRLVEKDFLDEMRERDIPVHYRKVDVNDIRAAFDQGGVPIVLISSYRIYKEKFPHWVVVTGFDDRFIYVHDPYVDAEKHKVQADCINMPILQKDFQRIARYGKYGQRAALIIRHPGQTRPARLGAGKVKGKRGK
ncbi:MAG TPA: GNAT family N-acetyltransferase/peptidase C39 family protein [Gammaproteobacteria bacterium]|nr:GNAT family N-acetyltransferase/peptidase C39 family protein [Gammaproteobacteria bacterium]